MNRVTYISIHGSYFFFLILKSILNFNILNDICLYITRHSNLMNYNKKRFIKKTRNYIFFISNNYFVIKYLNVKRNFLSIDYGSIFLVIFLTISNFFFFYIDFPYLL